MFIYAATTKLLDYQNFVSQLSQSPIIGAYALPASILIPVLEIVISLMLFHPTTRFVAFFAAFHLMSMFTAYIYIILNFSDFIPCSCGGVLEKMTWTQHIFFNLAFVALAIVGIFLTKTDNYLNNL
jgi:uncharacterized membrane protein YphA (DoxX/SURF4 family)